jgi:hypothetical protein
VKKHTTNMEKIDAIWQYMASRSDKLLKIASGETPTRSFVNEKLMHQVVSLSVAWLSRPRTRKPVQLNRMDAEIVEKLDRGWELLRHHIGSLTRYCQEGFDIILDPNNESIRSAVRAACGQVAVESQIQAHLSKLSKGQPPCRPE